MSLPTPSFTGIDIESIVSDAKTLLQDNLNTYIGQMNTDKPDITLPEVDNAAYVIQAQRDYMNYNPFVFIMESTQTSDGIGPATGEQANIEIFIVFRASDSQDIMWKKTYRYRWVLRTLFEKGWQSIGRGAVQVEVTNLPQTAIALLNSKEFHVGAGVSLQVNFA